MFEEKQNGGQRWGHRGKTEVGEAGRGQATPAPLQCTAKSWVVCGRWRGLNWQAVQSGFPLKEAQFISLCGRRLEFWPSRELSEQKWQ